MDHHCSNAAFLHRGGFEIAHYIKCRSISVGLSHGIEISQHCSDFYDVNRRVNFNDTQPRVDNNMDFSDADLWEHMIIPNTEIYINLDRGCFANTSIESIIAMPRSVHSLVANWDNETLVTIPTKKYYKTEAKKNSQISESL